MVWCFEWVLMLWLGVNVMNRGDGCYSVWIKVRGLSTLLVPVGRWRVGSGLLGAST